MNHNTRPLQHWERQGLIWNAQLSPTQKFVLFAYESFASADSHECFPSYGTIAEKTGYQKRTVIDAVGELVSLGILSKESRFRPNGSQTSNNYRIIYRALMGMSQMHPPHDPNAPPPCGLMHPPGDHGSPPELIHLNNSERTCVEPNLDEQPTHTPAEPKDLNSDQGKEENEALEKISSEEPESKVKNSHNPDKLENPKKESSAKERKVSAAENSTSPPGYAPKTAVGTFPDESAILNAWNGLKAQKWRAMAAGTIVGSSILGIQFFLNHANGDPSGAVTLFKKTLEVAANDDYFKKMSLRPNQALDPNSSAFIGHFLGDALQVEKPAPVSPTPDPAHTTTEPIQPTFFFGGL